MSGSSIDGIRVDHPHEHVTRITLDRPERRNALTWPMLAELLRVVVALRDEPARTVILTGAGSTFSVGLDLGHRDDPLGTGDEMVEVYRRQELLSRLVIALRDLPQPVVAAIDGPVAGGGFALTLAADLRICTEHAVFDAGFTRIGLSGGDAGVSALLPRIVGHGRAADVLLKARSLDAAEALASGLVSTVVADGEALAPEAAATATRIAGLAPFGVRMTKQLLRRAADGLPLETALELENRTQVLGTRTLDAQEGVRAFFDRRAPEFEGR